MARTAQEIYDGIKGYITSKEQPSSAWYAGITTDPKNRLFTEHNVSEVNGIWIYDQCDNNQDAKAIEETLLKIGCNGGTGGSDQTSTWVYAYLKTSDTKP